MRPRSEAEHGCVRGVLDCRRNLQETGLGDLRLGLILCDAQLDCEKLHRVLNRPAVNVGQRSNANDPDAKRADLEGEVGREILNRAKCGTNRGRSGHVWPSWATRHENDNAGALPDI